MDNKISPRVDVDSNEVSFFDLVIVIQKYKKSIILTVLLTFIFGFFYSFLLKPEYKSTVMILIDEPSSTIDIFDMGIGSDKSFLENEIEIIKSRSVAEKSIQKLIDSENKLFITNTIAYEPKSIQKILSFGFSEILYNTKMNSEVSDSIFDKAVIKLRKNISITYQPDSDILKVSVNSYDADEAALLANTLVDEYRLLDRQWITGEMTHLKAFLVEQIDKKEVELIKAENALKKFQEEEQILGVDNKSSLLLENLLSTESKLFNYKAEYNILNERKKYITNQLTEGEKKLVDNVSNSINDRLLALKNELLLKESELISAISQQGENHNIVKTIKKKIDGLRSKIEKETRDLISEGLQVADPIKYRQTLMDSIINFNSNSSIYEKRIEQFEIMVEEYEDQLKELPDKYLSYSRLARNLNIHTETYSLMRQKFEEARINEASKVGKVRIVDTAKPSDKPVKPSKRLYLAISILIGIIAGLLIALIRDYFDKSVTSIDDLEKLGLTILAIIPAFINNNNNNKKKYEKLYKNKQKIERRLITREDPKSPISESYRSLRTSISYSDTDSEDSSVILIGSPGPGEGKTTTIVNLAITYANLGKKTILIDGDLRKPVLHQIFSVDREPGITKFLNGNEKNYKKLIHKSDIENLSFITCGFVPPNPSEILASDRMKTIVESLKKDYDVILIDAPPLLAVTDAFILMKYVNKFVLVCYAGKTEKNGLIRALDMLKHSEAPFKGIVMNAVDENNSYGRGYYYNYYQYYYTEDNN